MSEPTYHREQDREHRVVLELTRMGTVDADVVCDAPPSAWCRQAPSCMGECEVVCAHPIVPVETCTIVDWLNGDVLQQYDGDPTPARSGVITAEWDGDGYLWSYADAP